MVVEVVKGGNVLVTGSVAFGVVGAGVVWGSGATVVFVAGTAVVAFVAAYIDLINFANIFQLTSGGGQNSSCCLNYRNCRRSIHVRL